MDEIQEFYKEHENKTLVELAHVMNDIRIKLEKAKEVKVKLEAKHDALRLNLIPSAMDGDGISNMSVKGIGRVTLTGDVYASIPAEQRPAAYKWLRENKHGDLIKETVNAGSFKAMVKRELKKGNILPEKIFKITPFSRASITKA